MTRYSAKILFQFRVCDPSRECARRMCEERIICYKAATDHMAMEYATAYGKENEYEYTNPDNHTVYFEFVGLLDILDLAAYNDPDQVWYDMHTKLRPMERRDKFVPTPDALLGRLRGDDPSSTRDVHSGDDEEGD